MRKYPIGLQSFRKIREGEFLYIDKTQLIYDLVNSGNYYFLSRPRRFGKSLLVDTIDELFSGSKELFEGLWIENHWNWEQKNPVIHISFSDIGVNTMGLTAAIYNALEIAARKLSIHLTAVTYDQQFRELIEKASVNGKVVILIDEYDKPIIDYLDNLSKAEEHRKIMSNFYSILKGADAHIRFLLITGVSRFSKVSIFSDLNNLNDITLSTRFGAIAGITQRELEDNFKQEIASLQQENGNILEAIKSWYNGYSWDAKTKVYNPFSLLNFMAEPVFRNYWFATGSPTFLIKGIRLKGEYNFENVSSNENKLGDFDPTNLLSVPLLFQTGYLTIKHYDNTTRNYTLSYPNLEVKDSLLDNLLSAYRGVFPNTSSEETGNLLLSLNANDIPGIINALNAVIGSIPFDHWRADTESIFHIITLLTFQKIGVDVQTEVHSNKGRCDILVKTDRYIYVIELKRDGTAEEALDQILNTNYLQPYAADQRKKIALGISFSSENRVVEAYLSKEI
ncbi:AAA family ATPase [Pedobacter sp. MC2016-24]|nr:AAA family ATPase [Pedobacter sp. MC2016-24]